MSRLRLAVQRLWWDLSASVWLVLNSKSPAWNRNLPARWFLEIGISALFAIAATALLYSIIGGVGKADFQFGPFHLGGSAAVLIGSLVLFNCLLERWSQPAPFNLEKHVRPAEGWFAIDQDTGTPISITIKDPIDDKQEKVIQPPREAILNLKVGEHDEDHNHLISGINADSGLGHISHQHLISVARPLAKLEVDEVFGPKRLYLVSSGELPPDKTRRWGSGECVVNSLPLKIEVKRFSDSAARIEVRPCASDESEPIEEVHLKKGDAHYFQLTIKGRLRSFLISVVAANHQVSPFWSSFLVIEMAMDDD